LQGGKEMNTTDNNQSSRSTIDKRKRINRMKTIIVLIVLLLMIIPTICCILLGIKVSRLQKQVNELVSIHGSQYGLNYDNYEDDQYAYAAEKTTAEVEKTTDSLELNQIEEDDSVILKEPSKESSNESSVMKEDKEQKEQKTASNQASKQDANQIKKKSKEEINSLSKGIYTGKKVYLTFDDGPSIYTDDILDILADYDIKATFFVVGKTDKHSKELYKRIVEEGHTLGMHSYSHIYKKIYNSIEDFDKDFTKLWKLLYDTTGYKPSIFRFPGGSDNLVNKNVMEEFIRYLNDASITYFDWNVVNGDATGVEYTKEQLINNVLEGVAIKETSIVLMHDAQTKETTVDSLPGLLDILIAEGAQILPIDKDTKPIQMIKAESLK
jgi:peptidoglycan/xylan/chitin deacetylase (PgdA/CDA1 family)